MEPPFLAPPSWARDTGEKLTTLTLRARNLCPDNAHFAKLLFSHFAARLEKLAAVLKEIHRDAQAQSSGHSDLNARKMDVEVKSAEQLIEDCSGRCALYMVMCCPELVAQLKSCIANFKTALDLLLQDGFSDSLKLHISQVKQLLEEGPLKLGPKEQTLNDSLEQGVLDSIVANPSLTMTLARQIADCLGVALESEGFGKELAKLKTEKESAEVRRGKAHSMYLEQFILLLEKAVASKTKPANGEPQQAVLHPSRTNVQRDTLILPLQSFICPITKDVMRDPVQIASGQTYERAAIERWFADGHTRCPTGVELKNTKMKSNFALRQSIAEWRERNYIIRLEHAHELLSSEDKEKQLKAVQDLQALCEEDSLNKYKVASKNLVSALVHLAESGDPDLRKKTFSALGVLAKDNSENQEIMAEEGVIEVITSRLTRQDDEAPSCVHLMRLLSEKTKIAEKISHAPGAVIFLVTMIEDKDCADDVKAILENLPTSDENVVIMAEANIMKPLVVRLNEGHSHSRILMAKTLGRLHFPDTSKISVATIESVTTLVKMMELTNEEESDAAVSALRNLSSVASVSLLVEKCGGIPILLKILKAVRCSERVKIGSAHIVANVLAARGDSYVENNTDGFDIEEIVCTFFQLMGPTTPTEVQRYFLQGLLALAHGKETGDFAKEKMKECQAFKILLHLLKTVSDTQVMKGLIELFSCLARTYGADVCAAFKEQPEYLDMVVKMLKEDRTEPERVAATTVFAHLPMDDDYIVSVLSQDDIYNVLLHALESRNESLTEAAAGALVRFTDPSRVELQFKLAGSGIIQKFVNLLYSERSLTKEWAAKALTNFSSSTNQLSVPPPAPNCWNCFPQRPQVCRLHLGKCEVESTFCLLEAGAIKPLLAVLKDDDSGCVGAALMALMTLVDPKLERWDYGCRLIAQANGLPTIINLMSIFKPPVQELSATLCERFFSLPEYRNQYGAAAQMHVVALAQKGSRKGRDIAGRILRQLELLHSQSNYFGLASS